MNYVSRITALAMVVAVAACSADVAGLDTSGEPILFITQDETETVSMAALFEGTVTRDEMGCLRMNSPERPMVVWPKGFSFTRVDGEYRVLDASGRDVGAIGESFRLGGGHVPTLHETVPVTPTDRQRALLTCPGLYWIVGS